MSTKSKVGASKTRSTQLVARLDQGGEAHDITDPPYDRPHVAGRVGADVQVEPKVRCSVDQVENGEAVHVARWKGCLIADDLETLSPGQRKKRELTTAAM